MNDEQDMANDLPNGDDLPDAPPAPAEGKIRAEDYKDVELDPSKLSSVNVLLESFEGPLDLMLFLIRKEKLDIFSVSLANITDQYLEVIRMMQVLDLDLAGEYLVVAGILVEYKSRALLPSSVAPPDEEDEEENAADLSRRLAEYMVFKRIADELSVQYEQRQRQFTRPPSRREVRENDDAQSLEFIDIDLFDLYATFKQVLDEIGELHPVSLSDEDFTVEEKIEEIRQLLLSSEDGQFNLSENLRNAETKLEIIVLFLATLEVVRLKLAGVRQLKSTLEVYIVAVIPPESWMDEHE